MKLFTYNQIFTRIQKIIKRFIKTKITDEQKILHSINLKYKLYSHFWSTIIKKSNEHLLHEIVINIYRTPDIMKSLSYYFEYMSKGNNEIKYYNILEYIAISYRHIAPTLRKIPRLYRLPKF